MLDLKLEKPSSEEQTPKRLLEHSIDGELIVQRTLDFEKRQQFIVEYGQKSISCKICLILSKVEY